MNLKKRILSFICILVLCCSVVYIPASAASYPNTHTNTGDQRFDIVAVAETQLGYREGSGNDTKYGDWIGLPNQPWCAIFVSWCAAQAEVPSSVIKPTGRAIPSYFGLSYKSGSSYRPQPGDLFFKKSFSHVGIVWKVEGDYFYTIEGNSNDTGSSEGNGVYSLRRKISNFYFSSPNYGKSKVLTIRYHANGATVPGSDKTYDTYTVVEALNLRKDAGTSHAVVKTISAGASIIVTATKKANGYTWGKTTYDGSTGWCVISESWTKKSGTCPVTDYYVNSSGLMVKSAAGSVYGQKMGIGVQYPNGLVNISTFGLSNPHHKFIGWGTSPSGGKIYDQNAAMTAEKIYPDITKGSKTITLYAQWSKYKLTISYNTNGGAISSDTYMMKDGGICTLSTGARATQVWTYNNAKPNGLVNASTFGLYRDGYTFKGWSTKPSGGTTIDQDNSAILPTDLYPDVANKDCSLELFAVWEPTDHVHSYGEYVYNNNATCERDGSETAYCACGVASVRFVEGTRLKDSSALFTDVVSDMWYKPYIDYAITHQILNGNGNGKMNPEQKMNRAEFVQILANLAQVDTTDKNVETVFTDATAGAWFAPAVHWAYENGIVLGTGEATFSPLDTIDRQQMCTMLVRFIENYQQKELKKDIKKTTFADDAEIADWAKEAVYACQQAGLVNGVSTTKFAPTENALRAQAAAVMSRYHQQY